MIQMIQITEMLDILQSKKYSLEFPVIKHFSPNFNILIFIPQ